MATSHAIVVPNHGVIKKEYIVDIKAGPFSWAAEAFDYKNWLEKNQREYGAVVVKRSDGWKVEWQQRIAF